MLRHGYPRRSIFLALIIMKKLTEMTLEELWELFPITLVPHQPFWADWADEEIEILSAILSDFSPKINHIGSTAIPGIQAKPIVDILVEVASAKNFDNIKTIMENSDYICMSQSDKRISFNKGYTPSDYAEKVFHIHIHLNGDNDEIRFRDYLRTHPEAAREYESLKLSLLPTFSHNRDAYTDAKSPFICQILKQIQRAEGRPVQ